MYSLLQLLSHSTAGSPQLRWTVSKKNLYHSTMSIFPDPIIKYSEFPQSSPLGGTPMPSIVNDWLPREAVIHCAIVCSLIWVRHAILVQEMVARYSTSGSHVDHRLDKSQAETYSIKVSQSSPILRMNTASSSYKICKVWSNIGFQNCSNVVRNSGMAFEFQKDRVWRTFVYISGSFDRVPQDC